MTTTLVVRFRPPASILSMTGCDCNNCHHYEHCSKKESLPCFHFLDLLIVILTGLSGGISNIPQIRLVVTVEIHSFHPVDFHR